MSSFEEIIQFYHQDRALVEGQRIEPERFAQHICYLLLTLRPDGLSELQKLLSNLTHELQGKLVFRCELHMPSGSQVPVVQMGLHLHQQLLEKLQKLCST